MNPLSHLSKRMRYVAGALAGAVFATGLVVLGASLSHSKTIDRQHVILTGDEGPAPNETTTTTTEDATTTSLTAPPLEQRVTHVEERVTTIEKAQTTPAGCVSSQGGWTCPTTPAPAIAPQEVTTTTVAPTTTTTAPSGECVPDVNRTCAPGQSTTSTTAYSPGPGWTKVDCSEVATTTTTAAPGPPPSYIQDPYGGCWREL
jgi:hypothetical protein